MSAFDSELDTAQGLVVIQRKEIAELFGFETRNKYEVRSSTGQPLGYAAEQQKGFFGFLFRQFLGHFRTFDVSFFDVLRHPVVYAHHPFRWFFQCLIVSNAEGHTLGSIERRWSWVSKRFDVRDAFGHTLLTVDSPLWHPWTFTFRRWGANVAAINKRWSGALTEVFTDADTFAVTFLPGPLAPIERRLLLAAAIFIDLMYFERKAD